MNSLPRIATLTTIRNGARVVGNALKSLANQTERPSEIIIVNDGSTDQTETVVRGLVLQLGLANVVWIDSGGAGRARSLNAGLEASRAEAVLVLDADDVLHPQALSLLGRKLYESDAAAASTHALRWSTRPPVWTDLDADLIVWESVSPRMLAWHNPIPHSGTLLRKVAIEEVGRYDEGRRTQLDFDLWVRLVSRGHRIVVGDKPLVGKRIHADQSFEARFGWEYSWLAFHRSRVAVSELRLPFPYRAIPYAKLMYNLTLRNVRRRMVE